MQDVSDRITEGLAGLSQTDWRARLSVLAEDGGAYHDLGKRHFATYIARPRKDVLIVTFETVQGIRSLSPNAMPFGADMVLAQGWSHLCVISDGDTWFRAPEVYALFDDLIDDGFFEEFDHVLFYGAGPCGYAASAFSVSAPGATVVAIQPQATLDPRMTEWDPRFTEMRRLNFTDRFGYAPDMMDAAQRGFVIYDPHQELDAMHAALFARPNVTRLRMPFMGSALQTQLIDMDILYPLLSLAGQGNLTEAAFFEHFRARRNNPAYLRALMMRLDADDRPYLNWLLCRNVTRRMHAPKFRRRLDLLEQAAEAGEFKPPIPIF